MRRTKFNLFRPKRLIAVIFGLFILIGFSNYDLLEKVTATDKNNTNIIKSEDKINSDDKNGQASDESKNSESTAESKSSDSTTSPVQSNINNDVKIHFINTGNSDSILIIDNDKSMLIDGGDNDDENTIVDFLKANNISTLDYMIATHPDADHVGGLDAVINAVTVKQLFVANGSATTKTYTDFINAAANKGLSPSVPLENNNFILDKSYFRVFNTNGGNNANEQSLVIELTNQNDKLLFMGDAGDATEQEILSSISKVDLVKIGHHGSSGSTSLAFLNKINPTYGVLLVGKNNSYGHPASKTMDTLQNKNIKIHRTDECGNILFVSTGNGLTTNCSEGSYNAGSKESTTSSSQTQTNNTQASTGSSNQNTTQTPTNSGQQNTTQAPTNSGQQNTTQAPSSNTNTSSSSSGSTTYEPPTTSRTVYWVPNGKSYHYSKGCSTLSRSKTILEGPGTSCPKTDPCDKCAR